MKTFSWILIILIAVSLMLLLTRCDAHDVADHRVSSLKSPVVVIAINCDDENAVLCGADGTVVSVGNASILGRAIANSRQVGDTIK